MTTTTAIAGPYTAKCEYGYLHFTHDLPAGTEVEHLDDCQCEDREDAAAVMLDDRVALPSLAHMDAQRLLRRKLAAEGKQMLVWVRERFNAQGERIGPEATVRSCEVRMIRSALGALGEALAHF